MKLSKKEQYLIDNGRSLSTVEFCRSCQIKSDNIVWFVNRIEKDNFNIGLDNSKEKIKIVSELFKRNKGNKERFNNIFDAIEYAEKEIEYDSNIESRIIYKFEDGHYILNLTEKELGHEGCLMSNCISESNYYYAVKNKNKAILALKDKKNKTLCHIEIDRAGTLCQHYQKANMPVNFERWKYINEFFKNNQDDYFFEKIKNSNLNNLYFIGRKSFNNIPTVNSVFPTKYSTSIFEEENKKFSSFIFIKEYANTNSYNLDSNKNMSIEDVEVELNNFKNFINNSIDSMLTSIKESKDNYFVLSDDVIKIIFGKTFFNKESKIKNIIDNEKYPMLLIEEGIGVEGDFINDGDFYEETVAGTYNGPYRNMELDFNFQELNEKIEEENEIPEECKIYNLNADLKQKLDDFGITEEELKFLNDNCN